MNAEVFAEWFRLRGSRVVRTASTHWNALGAGSYQAFPYHWVILPSEEELAQMLRKNRAVGLRYCTPLHAPCGRLSYQAVYEHPTYGFEDLGKWARKNVRRGLRNCVVEQISFDVLAQRGLELQNDTLDRQARRVRWSPESWRQCWRAAASLPGFEAWGAFVNRQLAASVVTFQMDDCCYMLCQQCRRDYLPVHANNALSFVVTRNMISRSAIRSILYGLHSLDAPASVDEFKFRMGYTPKPVRQRVVFHPLFSPLVNSGTHGVLKKVARLLPGSPVISKAEGMFRFYLEGKNSIQQQPVPEPLLDSGLWDQLADFPLRFETPVNASER